MPLKAERQICYKKYHRLYDFINILKLTIDGYAYFLNNYFPSITFFIGVDNLIFQFYSIDH